MKKNFVQIAFIAALMISGNAVAQSAYNAVKEASVVNWKGFKPAGEHYGTLALKDGYFQVKEGSVQAGEFQLDMNSIKNLDIPADSEYNAKLVGHLKNDDFFGVDKYPVATFKINKVTTKNGKSTVEGDLTIKEKTNPVTFEAEVEITDDVVTLKSETFKIDRSKWDIKFKSTSFFSDLGDNFIYDEIEISLEVKAKAVKES